MSYPPYSPYRSLALVYHEPIMKENPAHFIIFPIEHSPGPVELLQESPGIFLEC
jgi:hypothetical protein